MGKRKSHIPMWIFLIFAIFVLFAYFVLDIIILGRLLINSKFYEEFNQPTVPYIQMTATIPTVSKEQTRLVSATKIADECRDSCTYDDKCVGYVFDSLQPENKCKLAYDITGFVRNQNGLFTTSSGIKQRDFIGDRQPDRQYLRFEGHELPVSEQGKMVTHRFVPTVHDCKKLCVEATPDDSFGGKCIAFEYDFKTKACTLNNQVDGKMTPKSQKDTYVVIN